MVMMFALAVFLYVAVAFFVFVNSVMEMPGSYEQLARHLWLMLAVAMSWPLIVLMLPFTRKARGVAVERNI